MTNLDLTNPSLDASLHDLHRQILLALHSAVPSRMAVCYAGFVADSTHGSRIAGSFIQDNEIVALPPLSIEHALRHAHAAFGDERALLVELRHDAKTYGIGGVCQRAHAGSAAVASDQAMLDCIAPLLGSVIASHETCVELRRRELALRATIGQADASAAQRTVDAEHRLSPREREIARLLVAGYAAINAAAVLDLSEHTVRTYIRRLYRKLDVSNRADLVRTLVGGPQLQVHVAS